MFRNKRKADALGPRFDVWHSTPASTARSNGTGGSTAGGANDSLFVCACIENRAFEVGIAALDLKSNSMMLTQLGDSRDQNYSSTLAMMDVYEPVEIVVHDRSRSSSLRNAIETHVEDGRAQIVTIERKYFSDVEGMQFLKDDKLCVLTNVTIKGLESKYLAVAAARALHQYCSAAQRMPQGLPLVKVSLQVHENILLLDYDTVQTLELIENSKTGRQCSGSLFACVNKTKTAMGSRLMRSSLLQPLKNPEIIDARLDAVDSIIASSDLYFGLQQALESFPDLERLSSNLLVKSALELQFSSIGPINPTTIMLLLHLKTALIKVGQIVRLLEEYCGESALLIDILAALKVSASQCPTEDDPALSEPAIKCVAGDSSTTDSCAGKAVHTNLVSQSDMQACSPTSTSFSDESDRFQYSSVDSRDSSDCKVHDNESALQCIQRAVSTKLNDSENAKSRGAEQLRLQTVNLIKPGVDGYLDSARTVYTNLVDDVYVYRAQLQEEYAMEKQLQLCFRTSGYHFAYPASPDAGELPDISTQKALVRKKWIFKTKELSALNDRINESLTDIYQFTNAEVQEIFRVCRQQVSGLYKAAEAVSLLDLLLSFASMRALGKKYVRPQVASTAQNTLAIQQGRHPILETISPESVVPNDTFHNDKQNVAMISGPNMAGKSTYIKQVALCVVLAHIGAYVPADFFACPPIDRIFTRTSTADDLVNNESSFLTEMKEVARITRGLDYKPSSSKTSGSNTRALVIIDELGRGTSPTDGLSIAWAVTESLMQNDAFVLFVTHFDQLNQMHRVYSKIRNHHLSTTGVPGGPLKYNYALKCGACTLTSYGLSAAQVSGLPQPMLMHARKVSVQLAQKSQEQQARRDNASRKTAGSSSSARKLLGNLNAVKGTVLATDESALRGHLKALQEEFMAR